VTTVGRRRAPVPTRKDENVTPRRITKPQAHRFLTAAYGSVDRLEMLGGGFWSSAFGFSHAGRELVVRFGANRDWFEADRAAMAFDSPDLPVPEVIEIGEAFGGAYAVSARRRGIHVEDVRPDQRDLARPMLSSLLEALFRVPSSPDMPVGWHWRPPRPDLAWRTWLLGSLSDDPSREVHGWRAAIATDSAVDRIYRACEARVGALADACPERRDLVHGDLLHANVLVTEDARQPVAVFSWKCSVRGDFLFDLAWCSFWSAWHPGIAAVDPWSLQVTQPRCGEDAGAWVDAPERHHCYELQIGATHLGWHAWLGDAQEMQKVARRLAVLLEQGPRGLPPGLEGLHRGGAAAG
jgi:aminoglycoside phosphotransferase (APT) family kinase protein